MSKVTFQPTMKGRLGVQRGLKQKQGADLSHARLLEALANGVARL